MYLPCPWHGKVFTLGRNAGLMYVRQFRARPDCPENVHSFLCLLDMFVYVAPDGHGVNLQSSFELQKRNIGFKLGHKIGAVS